MADIIQTPSIKGPTYANGVLDYALNVAPLGLTQISMRYMGTSDLPYSQYIYATANISKRSSNAISVTIVPDYTNLPIITNVNTGDGWAGWNYCGCFYASSQSSWDSTLLGVSQNRQIPFSMGTTPTNAIFGLGNYVATGYVTPLSATKASGSFVCNDEHYDFVYNPTASTLTSLKQAIDEKNGIMLVADHNGANNSTAFTMDYTGEFASGLLSIHKTNISGAAQAGLYLVNAYLRSGSGASSNKAYVTPIITPNSATVAISASTTEQKMTITVTPSTTYVGAKLYRLSE